MVEPICAPRRRKVKWKRPLRSCSRGRWTDGPADAVIYRVGYKRTRSSTASTKAKAQSSVKAMMLSPRL